MGWKVSMIIINKPTPVNHEQLLHDLGFRSLTKIGEKTLDRVINPDQGEVYIGTYKDNIIICESNMPIQFTQDDAEAEGILTNKFPASEICSLVLHSTVNLWGYSIVKDGERLRARAGTAETGTILDEGEPLEEEKYLLNKSKLGAGRQRIYLLDDLNEPLSEDQVGENFVFAISQRYFGESIEASDDLLFNTKLVGYSV